MRKLLPLLIISGLLLAAWPPMPAAAQCTYTYTWTFDTTAEEWDMGNWTWTGGDGNNNSGAIVHESSSDIEDTLSLATILSVLNLHPDSTILRQNVTFEAYIKTESDSDFRLGLYFPGGSFSNSAPAPNSGEWEYLSVWGNGAGDFNGIGFRRFNSSDADAIYVDDAKIIVPCANVTSPTPEPTDTPTPGPSPTPTNTPVPTETSTPGPTATPANTPTPSPTPFDPPFYEWPGDGPPFLQPFPLPTRDPNNRINTDPLWDYENLTNTMRAVVTVWVLADQYRVPTLIILLGALMFAVKGILGRGGNGRSGGGTLPNQPKDMTDPGRPANQEIRDI